MRYLILSDIHGNWEALEAVLAQASGQYEQILNCGDLVGYGPDPNRVVEFCRDNCRVVVRGNHDKVVAGLADMEWFNPVARQAVVWAQAHISAEARQYLHSLPQGPLQVDDFSVMHGSPFDEDEYLMEAYEARAAAAAAATGLSFFGHTHLQGGFFVHRNGLRYLTNEPVQLEDTASYLINPGSVGQPRDRDPRAAYAIYDSAARTVTYFRTDYAIEKTHRKILAAGLPGVLGERLYRGH